MKTAIVALVGMLIGCSAEPGATVVSKHFMPYEEAANKGIATVVLTLDNGRVCLLSSRGAEEISIGDRIVDTTDGYACQDGRGWR